MTLTFFLLLRARPDWLALPRDRRNALGAEVLAATGLADLGPVRFFDAEAFGAHCSDVLMVETADLPGWSRAIDRLRDSALLAVPYFELVAIVPAIEDGFRRYAPEAA